MTPTNSRSSTQETVAARADNNRLLSSIQQILSKAGPASILRSFSPRRLCLLWGAWLRLVLTSMASRWGLTLLNLFGVVLAVALLSNSAFFAHGVDRALLQEQLDNLSSQTGRAPFSLRLYLLPSARRPLQLGDAEQVASDLAGTLSTEVALPAAHLGIEVQSGSLMLQAAAGDTRYTESNSYISMVNAVYIANVVDHIEFVAGEVMDPAGISEPDAMNVWMHADMAAQMGVNIGETYQLALNVRYPIGSIRIAGFWQARDADEPFWFSDPDAKLRDALLVQRQDYMQTIQPVLASGSRLASWHIILDDSQLNPGLAQAYVQGFQRSMLIIDRYLPGAQLDVSPLGSLEHFVARQAGLTRWLLLFNLPALAVLLYFLLLVAQVGIRRQRREISILVSRGMGKSALVSVTTVDQLLIVLVGLPIGLVAGMGLARLMGYTAGFLTFTARPPLRISMQGFDPWLVAIAVVLTFVARIIPLLRLSSRSIVDFERSEARPVGRPFWQRAYLDILLVAPTAYVYHQLRQGASMAGPSGDGASGFLHDPLLVLAPALFLLTASLLVMRIFPLLMRLFDFLAARTNYLLLHLALRQLSRHAQSYATAMLLVTALLAMGIYTVSLAASLDQWLIDKVYYRIGADARFLPIRVTDSGAEFVVPPPGMFDSLPSVAATSRVGEYPVEVRVGDDKLRGRFLGIDRHDFAAVVWFRRDFAGEALGALMNRLALDPANVLVPSHFLQEHQLQMGDTVPLSIGLEDGVKLSDAFTVAGVYDYFPTVHEQEVVIVGNLENLYLMAGAEFPYYIWLRVAPGADNTRVFDEMDTLTVEPGRMQNAALTIAEEQAQLERVGIFGTLSVGFLAAALMTGLTLFVHGFAALGSRAYQFGVLQALGLPRRQVLIQVVVEYGILTGYSASAGAAIGLFTTLLFAPFLQSSVSGSSAEKTAQLASGSLAAVPPLLPLLALDKMVQLALLFAIVMVVLQLLVLAQGLRRRLFSTLVLGHQG